MRLNVTRKIWLGIVMTALVAMIMAPAASASGMRIEGFAGYFTPDKAFADSDFTFGLRFGYDFNEKFGLEFTGEFFNADQAVAQNLPSGNSNHFDLDIKTYGTSFVWYPTGKGFYLLGGPSFTAIELKVMPPGDGNDRTFNETVFGLHAGLGYLWKMESGFYIRPDVRFHWLDQDFRDDDFSETFVYSDMSWGAYIGFGYAF